MKGNYDQLEQNNLNKLKVPEASEQVTKTQAWKDFFDNTIGKYSIDNNKKAHIKLASLTKEQLQQAKSLIAPGVGNRYEHFVLDQIFFSYILLHVDAFGGQKITSGNWEKVAQDLITSYKKTNDSTKYTTNQKRLMQYYLATKGKLVGDPLVICDGVIGSETRKAMGLDASSKSKTKVSGKVDKQIQKPDEKIAPEQIAQFKRLKDTTIEILTSKAPKSPLLKYADHIVSKSIKTNVPLPQFLFIVEKETGFGSRDRMTTKYNYGNVGNTDNGKRVSYQSPVQGINAVFKNLGERNKIFEKTGRPFDILEFLSGRSRQDALDIIKKVEGIKLEYGGKSVAEIIKQKGQSKWLTSIIDKYPKLEGFKGIYMSNTDVRQQAQSRIQEYDLAYQETPKLLDDEGLAMLGGSTSF